MSNKNRGNIPGYYFDEEKQKYFKIQADHAVPAGAKHARSNVKYEKHVAKKRRRNEKFESKRRTQTLQHSKLYTNPSFNLPTLGLRRELGTRSSICDQIKADEAWISGFTHVHKPVPWGSVLFAHPIDSISKTLLTVAGPIDELGDTSLYASCVYMDPYDMSRSKGSEFWDAEAATPTSSGGDLLASLAGFVSSTSVGPANDSQMMVITAYQSVDRNVWISTVGSNQSDRCMQMRIGDDQTTLWGSEIDPTGTKTTITGSKQLCLVDLDQGRYCGNVTNISECRCATWFSPQVVAACDKRAVMLWDTRSNQHTTRFYHSETITGLKRVPNSCGNQVLVSSNRKLTVWDVRMAGRNASEGNSGLLSMPTYHEVPQAVYDVNERGVVAASVKRGTFYSIDIMSLRTGGHIRTLELPSYSRLKLPTQLAWREDERGAEYLQACIGDEIFKWSYQDHEEESDLWPGISDICQTQKA